MSDTFLTIIINYGAPAFALLLFMAALGVPISASALVIAAGAFAQQEILAWPTMALLGWGGVVFGDVVSFGIGLYARDWVNQSFGNSPLWRNAKAAFDRRAGMAIYLTRFLITALATPTNLIAGGSGIPFRRFLFYAASGELTWIVLYGGLGYVFGSQWEVVNEFTSNFGGLLLGLLILAAGIWLARRRLRTLEASREKNDRTVEPHAGEE